MSEPSRARWENTATASAISARAPSSAALDAAVRRFHGGNAASSSHGGTPPSPQSPLAWMGLQYQLGLSADRKQSAEDARRDVMAARAARSSSEEVAKAQAAARKTADETLWREASAAVFGAGGGPSSSRPLDAPQVPSRREAIQVRNQELNTATAGFSGRFHVAGGGFGNVFRVPHLPSLPGAGAVAIKQQQPNSGEDPKKEVELLGKCRHPNVLPLLGYSLGTASCLACLIYPLMTGGTLEDRLLLNAPAWERLQKLGHTSLPAPLPWHLRLRILRDTMRALVYLHTPTATKPRTLHCDVKPSNVLLDAQLNACLADFGMSKMSSSSCVPNPSVATGGHAENVPPQRVVVSTGGGSFPHRHSAAAAVAAAAAAAPPRSPARTQLRGPPLTMPSPITAESCRTLTASFLGDGLSVYDDTDESPSLTASPARVPSPSISEAQAPPSAPRRASAPTSLVASPLRPTTHPPPPLGGGDGARRVLLSLPPAATEPELHRLPVYDDVDDHPYQAAAVSVSVAVSRAPSRQQSSEASPLQARPRPSHHNERRPSTEGIRRRGEALNSIAQFDSARDEDERSPPARRDRHRHHHRGDGVPVYDDVPDSHAPFVSSPKPTPAPRPPPPRRVEERRRRPSGIGEALARDWERANRHGKAAVEEEEEVSPGGRLGPGGFGVASTARQQLVFGLPGTALADWSPPDDDDDDDDDEAQPRRPGKPSTRGTQWFIDPLYIDGTEERALAVPRSEQQCHTSELTDGYAMGVTVLVTLTAQPPADLIRICEEMLKQPSHREAWAAPGVADRSAGCWPAKVEHGLAGLVRGLSWVPLEEERTPLPEALRQLEALASTAGVDGADDF